MPRGTFLRGDRLNLRTVTSSDYGFLREQGHIRGEYRDTSLFGLLADEWDGARSGCAYSTSSDRIPAGIAPH